MHDDDVVSHLLAAYIEKGISEADARSLVGILRGYPILMRERYCAEIEGVLPAEDDGSPVTEGKITFQSFLLFGSLPLVPIMVALMLPESDNNFNMAIGFSILFTVLTLGMLGYTKARLASQPKLMQVGLMVTNGVVCAGVSFLVSFGSGEALENLFGGK
jgi:VIT1/CCC1 family predicted Fe2+/Mn2+ transporter